MPMPLSAMIRPWSVTTTLRNPERMRGFLSILRQLEGAGWAREAQVKYQILLIQSRLYGAHNRQFMAGLSKEHAALINDITRPISFAQAAEIFDSKKYEDPPMRGRQSINALKKLGFVSLADDTISFTEGGRELLKNDFDYEEALFKPLLKWQISNPVSPHYRDYTVYNIKPFIGTLHLIDRVNKMEEEAGNEPKGISKEEFSVFAHTLVHWRDIDKHARRIVAVRQEQHKKSQQEQRIIFDQHALAHVLDFLRIPSATGPTRLLNNLRDYGDNAIRYFRLTRYIYIRGGGFYVDLEKRRAVEINALLAADDGRAENFQFADEYLAHLADFSLPRLPWESREKYAEIVFALLAETGEPAPAQVNNMDLAALKRLAAKLRSLRRKQQEAENREKAKDADEIRLCAQTLKNIFKEENRPVLLEKLATTALRALNDAIDICPNYPVGDDNEPTFTAPANVADIECFYADFNAVCEVTMLTGRNQWYHEGQPVMRHLRDFEDKHADKPAYCLFVAPRMHRDTINTFLIAVKHEYEGKKQKIVPLSIANFVSMLGALLAVWDRGGNLTQADLSRLYDEILLHAQKSKKPEDWLGGIPLRIAAWQKQMQDRAS